MDDAARGATALAARNFALAIQLYTSALTTHPHAVDYYIKRSTAFTRTTPPQPLLALTDAEAAVVLATRRGKRELIAQAQLRRAIALFGVERWADARRCVAWARELAPKEASLGMWEAKIEAKMTEGKKEMAEAVVQELPDVVIAEIGARAVDEKKRAEIKGGEEAAAMKNQATELEKPAESLDPVEQAKLSLPEHDKFRWDWYQSQDTVTVNLMMKRVPKDATIEILPTTISLTFTLPSGSTFDFSLDPLFGHIDPAQSTAKIMSTKVEWILRKTAAGEKWKALEGASTASNEAPSTTGDQAAFKSAVLTASTPPTAPTYPTSSKSGPKDWDKLAQNLIKSSKKPDPTSTTTASNPTSTANDVPADENDDDDDDNDGGDPVNGFFKKLFRNADPDTRRAMMKSYQESNGTALSTNWDEVGKAPVETSPPDGMVARKWGQ